MNKKNNLHIILLSMLMVSAQFLTSCIRDEAPNAEADILTCALGHNTLIREPIITNNEVKLYVNGWENLTELAPAFTLSEGATIEPASGTIRNFTTPQKYVVTSQEGKWHKTYTVSFLTDDVATEYHFENVKYYDNPQTPQAEKIFHIFYDKTVDNNVMEWGSANDGYRVVSTLAQLKLNPSDFPTSQADNGVKGKCLKLKTCSTGAIGIAFGTPIAAGNLFTGVFDTYNMLDVLKATKFGVPFTKKPKMLTGYYKYKAGEKYTNKKGKVLPDVKDSFDIYSVLYEVTPSVPMLDGTNSLSSKNIVLMARLQNKIETNKWIPFSIDFKPVNGKHIDENKLKSGKYNIAIVMSSSIDGAHFNGAVGSTLYVDEMRLFYHK